MADGVLITMAVTAPAKMITTTEPVASYPWIKMLVVWLGVISIVAAGGAFLAIFLSLHHYTLNNGKHPGVGVSVTAGILGALLAATPYLVVTALLHLFREITDSVHRLEWWAAAIHDD
jgi:hypothetical protein